MKWLLLYYYFTCLNHSVIVVLCPPRVSLFSSAAGSQEHWYFVHVLSKVGYQLEVTWKWKSANKLGGTER